MPKLAVPERTVARPILTASRRIVKVPPLAPICVSACRRSKNIAKEGALTFLRQTDLFAFSLPSDCFVPIDFPGEAS